MLTISLKGTTYKIKTDWKDVTLSDYIRWEQAKLWRSRFIALNPGTADLWDNDPDFGLSSMAFMGEDPIDNHLNPIGEGLPTVATSTVRKYWDALSDIQDSEGLSVLELGAKLCATYFDKTEQEVLQMPVLEVYGAISFFLEDIARFSERFAALGQPDPNDPDQALLQQAGIGGLGRFGNFATLRGLMKTLGQTREYVLELDAEFVYVLLTYDKEEALVYKEFHRLKSEQK